MVNFNNFTKPQLIVMLKEAMNEAAEGQKAVVRNKFPIEPMVPFKKMGELEKHRWRYRYRTHEIENNNGKHDIKYINQERRNRLNDMKEFVRNFNILRGLDREEADKFQEWYDKFLPLIQSEESELKQEEIRPNYAET